jgi:uncharacterized protein
MRRFLSSIVVVSIVALSVPGVSVAASPEVKQRQVLAFAAHSTGSSWYSYAAGLASIFAAALPKGSVVDVLPYAAALGNVMLVDKKEAHVGLTFGHVAAWGYQGTVAFDQPKASLRALGGGLDQYYGGLIMRKDFADRHGIKTVGDIVGKKVPVRIVTGPPGSLSEYMTGLVLKIAGASYADVRAWGGSVQHVDVPTAGTMIQDGRADTFLTPFTVGYPVFTEIAVRTRVMFPGVDESLLEGLARYGFAAADFPAGSFRGQDAPVRVMAFRTMLLVHESMDHGVAYTLTKAMVENAARFPSIHAAMGAYRANESWRPEVLGGVPLHPGARAYYIDAGLMK